MDDGVLLIILQKLPSLRSRIAAAMVTKGFLRVAFAPSNNTSTFACGYRMSKRGRRCCSQEPSLLSDTLPKLELWRCRKVKGLGLPGLRDGYRDFNFDMPIRQAAAAATSLRLASCATGACRRVLLVAQPGAASRAFLGPTTPKGNPQALKDTIMAGGGTAEIVGTPRRCFLALKGWFSGSQGVAVEGRQPPARPHAA
jgi:hypothetical protein